MADKTDIIAEIYDAIIDTSRWDEVVKRIVAETKSLSGNLVVQQAEAGSLTALYNVDPVLAQAYAQTYHKDDPLKTPEWRIAPGEVRECSYTQTDSFKASAYYDEFVRHRVNLRYRQASRCCLRRRSFCRLWRANPAL